MTDVFVSYARADELHAVRVVEALDAAGYRAWRDDQLPAHRPYADVIQERLRSARAVLVLWSEEAVKSQWVRAEADVARAAGTLIQALLDGAQPPLPFNQIQCADLADWDGARDAPGWRKVEASVSALTGPPEVAAPQREQRGGVSICVLPFANMSGDAEQEYFSDGICEDITTDLSKVSALEVIARNTAFTFKGKAVDVCDVARKLGVSHVLEGSVRKAANCVRITAQLIDGKSGGHVWAERYDRDLTDIFAIQDEISKAIVGALKIKLLPTEKKAIADRGTSSVEAYNLYLRARQNWISGDFADPGRAGRIIRICARATQVDPDYAQAWALMALAQAHIFYGIGTQQIEDDGAAAATRALAIDPKIAEAHLPIAWRLVAEGKTDAANAEIDTALQLGPDSWEVNKEAARLYFRQRRVDDAVRMLERATELMEADFHGWGMLLAGYNAQGNQAGALRCAAKMLEQAENYLRQNGDNGMALALGANGLAFLGERERAREWIEQAILVEPDNLFVRYNLAWGQLAIAGDVEAAISMLEPVLAKGGPSTIRLAAMDPNLQRLRDDPRFQAMLEAAKARVTLNDGA